MREEQALLEAQKSGGRLATFVSGLAPGAAVPATRRVALGA